MKKERKPRIVLKFSTIFLAAFISTQILYAQECVNGISTNPDNPSSPYPFNVGTNNLWLNQFNIGTSNASGYNDIRLNPNAGWLVPDYTTENFTMMNPFIIGATPSAPYLAQPVTGFPNQDWHWEDGWELLWLGTGFYPNGDSLHVPPENSVFGVVENGFGLLEDRIPYIILYNRYRSIVRVFAGIFAPYGSVDDLSVSMVINESVPVGSNIPYNGLMRHLGNYDTPLDQETAFIEHQGHNSVAGSGTFNNRKWYSYDFLVGFDPCTCGQPGIVDFKISAVDSSSLSLYGREISLEQALTDAQGNPIYPEDFLTAVSIEEQDPNGYMLKNTLDSLIGDYQNNLEIYQNSLDDQTFAGGLIQSVLEAAGSNIVDGVVSWIPAASVANWIIDKQLNISSSLGIDMYSDPAEVDSSAYGDFVQSASKGALGYGFDQLMSTIYKKDNIQRPSRPVATFSEMRLTGKIEDVNTTTLSGFFVPGSDRLNIPLTPFNYPAYNEVLGLYATLKTPQVQKLELGEFDIEVYNIQVDVDSSDFDDKFVPDYTRIDSSLNKDFIYDQQIYLKVKDPISWAINNAVDIDTSKSKYYASFSVIVETDDPILPSQDNLNSIDSIRYSFSENTNLWPLHDIADGSSTPPIIKRTVELVSGWHGLNDISNLLFGTEIKTTVYTQELFETEIRHNPPWWTDGIEEDELKANVLESQLTYRPIKIVLKIMADFYFEQESFQGEEINTTQMFSYLIFDEAQGVDLISDQGNNIDIADSSDFVLMFPGVLTMESNVLDENSPEITDSFFSQSNVDSVRADRIVVNDSLRGFKDSNGDGELYHLLAHSGVKMVPGTHLKSNLHLGIMPELYGNPTSYPASDLYLSSFCSNDYNASQLKGSLQKIRTLEDDSLYSSQNSRSNYVSIFPNPTRDLLTIRSSPADISAITIHDLSGRTLKQQSLQSHSQEVQVNVSDISPGTYIVSVVCGSEVLTEKLVVAK